MTRVLVAVPAHDEVDEVGACLESVVASAREALAQGSCSAVTVGVALHRCTDGTGAAVEEALRDWPDRLVVTDTASRTVGGVRAGLVRALVDEVAPQPPSGPAGTWLFNTDADSRVPRDWVSATLAQLTGTGASASAGLVELRGWVASAQAREDYRRLLEAGVHGAAHTHVYGANLAVRLDAYARVGGFRPVHAEDQDLVDRLRLAGEHVATLLTPVVRTSAREPGRADAGLGALLRSLRLAATDATVPDHPVAE